MRRKSSRITARRLKSARRQFKELAAVYEKTDLTKMELAVCNYHNALIKTMNRYKDVVLNERPNGKVIMFEKEYIEVLVWLYQFEWFEWDWAKNNFVYAKTRQTFFGVDYGESKFFTKKITLLYKSDYIEGQDYYDYKYEENEQREGFIRAEEKETDARYRLSNKGVDVIRTFFKHLTGETPSRYYKRTKKLKWSDRAKRNFMDDYMDLN